MKYQLRAIKRCGRTLNAHYSVKEANLQGLHTVWFQLYDMLEKGKLLGGGGRKEEEAERRGFLVQRKYPV